MKTVPLLITNAMEVLKEGSIAHPNATSAAKKEQRLYQSKIMNNGHMATVIEYRGLKNNTVEFDNGEKCTM